MKRRSALSACALAFIAHWCTAPAWAEPVFAVHNEAALARSFALPALGATQVRTPSSALWRLALDWSNEFVVKQNASESLTEDGETQRYSLYYARGFGAGLELNAALPVLITGGGVLDGIIQNWHDFWGLPNGGRQDAPHDRYLFQYIRNHQTLLMVDQGTVGLGDLELGAGWQALGALALRAMVKLPTGDAGKLTGGNAGGALWADYDPFQGSARWFGFVSLGASYNAKGEVLTDQQRQFVGLVGAGAGFRLFRPFALMAQLYGHTPLYSGSAIGALTRDGLQIAFGGRYDFGARTQVNLGFQEDLSVNTSPDFSIHLDVTLR
jgi:hypothetical protein